MSDRGRQLAAGSARPNGFLRVAEDRFNPEPGILWVATAGSGIEHTLAAPAVAAGSGLNEGI